MKIKLESSSYSFKTKEEEDSFKARIKDSLDIDVEKFEFNAGLRSIAKLCLNSLWGKFGQRNNMSQTKYVTDVSEFYEILLDDKLGNKNFHFINDDMVQMTYNFKDQFVDNSNNTNIYIACFTTSHARLMLYDKLDYLNEKVLYFDTDSIIYADDNTKNIETGDMTDEISGKGISSFVSTGPKSYSFKYGDDEQKSAIKGFTLNHENNNLLNHDSLSKIVKRQIREITIVNENKITRKNREIVNKYCEKIFKFGYDKRVHQTCGRKSHRHTTLWLLRYPFCVDPNKWYHRSPRFPLHCAININHYLAIQYFHHMYTNQRLDTNH